LHRHEIGKPNKNDRRKSNSFIHGQISTSLIVAKGIRVVYNSIIMHILVIVMPIANCHLLEEGGFEIIAELLKFSEALKWDGLTEEGRNPSSS
jgi:hypothetical protein